MRRRITKLGVAVAAASLGLGGTAALAGSAVAASAPAGASVTDPVGTVEALIAQVIIDVNCLPHEILSPSTPTGCAAL